MIGLLSCFPELNGHQKLSGSFSAQRERGNSSAIALGVGQACLDFSLPPISTLGV